MRMTKGVSGLVEASQNISKQEMFSWNTFSLLDQGYTGFLRGKILKN